MIRIRGGPNPASVSVVHVDENGAETVLRGVRAATWRATGMDDLATVTLEMDFDFEVDVAGQLAES